MKTGTAIVVLAGVGAAGGGAYLLLRSRGIVGPAAAAKSATGAPIAAGAPAARQAPPAVTQLANGLQAINQAGCQAIAARTVGAALAAQGCSTYTKYLSPIGATSAAIHLVEKIPILGGGVKTVENAVSKVVSKPISAVKNFLGGLF